MLEAEKAVLGGGTSVRRSLPSPPVPSRRRVWRAIRRQQEARTSPLPASSSTRSSAMLKERFVAITGAAGTGKTAVVAAAADVWHAQDRRVFGLAVAGATAQRLGEGAGEEVIPMTLDGWMTRVEHGLIEIRDDDVIVLDEAGMVDTLRWARFVAAVGDRATVVALGDDAQLSPLSAGGLWPLLAQGGPELHEVHRTKEKWERGAWGQLRIGNAEAALRLYARCGHVSMSGTRSEARTAAVDAWDGDGRTGVILTDASNAERDTVNVMAQNRRRAAGELGDVGVTLSPAARVVLRRGPRHLSASLADRRGHPPSRERDDGRRRRSRRGPGCRHRPDQREAPP